MKEESIGNSTDLRCQRLWNPFWLVGLLHLISLVFMAFQMSKRVQSHPTTAKGNLFH
jgi:hypothetical protein